MTLRSEQNKHKIINAAFVLALKYGFDRVSIKMIQEESGLASGTIYYHYKDKDEILTYMVKTYLLISFDSYSKDIKQFKGTFKEKIEFIFKYKNTNFGAKGNDESIYIPNRPKFHHKEYFMLFKSIYHFHPHVRHIL